MTMRTSPRHAAGLLAGAMVLIGVAACSSGPPPPAPEVTPPPSAAAPTSTSPTPPPSKAADLARAQESLITAKELGTPWVAVKKVNSAGTKGEACPGQATTDATVSPLASAAAQFTAGKQRGAAIGVFTVWTYRDAAAVDAYEQALPKVLRACRSYVDSAKLYVVLTPAGSAAVDGADETWRYAERIYYDAKHTKLAYARHYVIARHGRVLSGVQYAFLTGKSDAAAKDFSLTERMASQQFGRVMTTFGEG